MKIERLWIKQFKNLRESEVIFEKQFLLNAFIGGNGSGKSNLLEAVLHILLDVYFNTAPPFDFVFNYEAHGKNIELSKSDSRVRAIVDSHEVPIQHFSHHIRDVENQNYYPESTFAYYSGDCDRVRRLLKRYQTHFRKLVQRPEKDSLQPLFVISTNHHARNILLSLIAHGHRDFLKRLNIAGALHVEIVLRSPKGFNPTKDEPVLWGTSGKVGKTIATLAECAEFVESKREYRKGAMLDEEDSEAFTEYRSYFFSERFGPEQSLWPMASRLEMSYDNLYLVLEHLAARGILKSVEYNLVRKDSHELFDFEQLSEGEKQLIAVVGAIRLTNQRHNLILLDEPDTHLNPHWAWEYPEMLEEAVSGSQKDHSTILMATHDPVVISGMVRQQVFLARGTDGDKTQFVHPYRNPQGQGVANILCSSEFFGLPSSLDKETQKLLDERLRLSIKPELSLHDKARLKSLNEQLQIITPGVSERDPEYVEFLRARHSPNRR